MSRPTYSLTFHQNGVKRFAVTVLAQPAYAIGDYHLGQAYEPPSPWSGKSSLLPIAKLLIEP